MQIYAISHNELTPYNKLPDMLDIALKSGVSIFQFRDKNLNDNAIFNLCCELGEICSKNNASFIINDRINLALRLQDSKISCGLHLGKGDLNMPFYDICSIFKGNIGVSCYGDISKALEYQNLGADYVAFGSIFQSPTKTKSIVIGYEILKEARSKLDIKICAIGGINASNVRFIKNIDMIAMISSIWIGDIKENIYKIKNIIYENKL
ncbi:thiamine phosphate synthase [Helicobacter sp. MIT 14-3879]|uniref:thiamine phosphate synthase n=1 Tax=Helicobacter sp. MIT 14-3879 TaxID=2040649 RepID=UPI000E1F8865|nr:thiamine phosphate synthase [Helicobacter sp. MIT 14-3879]RDU63144.1 thiamine phosphate synthase [Helicobacter sp. MIT 14-3879]